MIRWRLMRTQLGAESDGGATGADSPVHGLPIDELALESVWPRIPSLSRVGEGGVSRRVDLCSPEGRLIFRRSPPRGGSLRPSASDRSRSPDPRIP